MLQLRDYQRECLTAISEAARGGISKPLISLPTGTGKTVIFAYIIKRIGDRDGRSLVLVHRDELLNQAEDKLLTIWPEAQVGIVKSERNELDALVTIASVQTASREARLSQIRDIGFDFVVTDEAHHAVADSYQRIYDALLGDRDAQLHLGVTATVNRADRRGLREVYQKVVYHRSLLDMIRAGWLCDLRCVQVKTDVSLDSVRTRQGDFAQGELASVVNTENRNELIVKAYQEHAAGRLSLCFTVDVEHARNLAGAFQGEGINAISLSGKTPILERRKILKGFHNREIDVIANCQVLTEGYDEPAVDCIILARPTKSSVLYTQMVGRGTRRFPGKSDCLILDFADVAGHHRIVQLPDLVGMEKKTRLDGKQTLTELVDQERGTPVYGEGKGIRAAQVDIFDRSRFQWIVVRRDHFLLNLGDYGKIQVIPSRSEDRYVIVHTDRAGESEYLSDRPTLLSWAMGIAESEAEEITRGKLGLVLKSARWRSEPATQKQLRILDLYRVEYDRQRITKGEASDLISILFAGSRSA